MSFNGVRGGGEKRGGDGGLGVRVTKRVPRIERDAGRAAKNVELGKVRVQEVKRGTKLKFLNKHNLVLLEARSR